jgi:uroporphyrinogen decarboxylase
MTVRARDRIVAALEHRTLDRIPMCEHGIWPETIQRWESEGLPKGVHPVEHFGLDTVQTVRAIDTSFFAHEVYEDTDEYCVDLNGEGTVVKWYKDRGSSSGHMELDHRIQTIDHWREAKQRLTVTPERLGAPARAVDPDAFHVVCPVDHFWMSFRMCGMENLCCWLMQEPGQMREIYDNWLDFLLGMLDLCVEQGPAFDAIWCFTDMAFHSGPMFSPQVYKEVIAPGYARLRDWCDRHNK